MKFKVEDNTVTENIIVNDYQSAFEIIKDKVMTKLHDLNKAELIEKIGEKPHKTQYLTDGITITIVSIPSEKLSDLEDTSIAATITFDFKNEKDKQAEVYKIIKNPKADKKKDK